jgi:hypothetical protein
VLGGGESGTEDREEERDREGERGGEEAAGVAEDEGAPEDGTGKETGRPRRVSSFPGYGTGRRLSVPSGSGSSTAIALGRGLERARLDELSPDAFGSDASREEHDDSSNVRLGLRYPARSSRRWTASEREGGALLLTGAGLALGLVLRERGRGTAAGAGGRGSEAVDDDAGGAREADEGALNRCLVEDAGLVFLDGEVGGSEPEGAGRSRT